MRPAGIVASTVRWVGTDAPTVGWVGADLRSALLRLERRLVGTHAGEQLLKDKYDLVAWMFEQDYQAAMDVGAPYTQAFYAESHRRLWSRRGFYRRAFEEDAQNSIGRYLMQMSIEANEAALRRYLGVPVLSREHAFVARHFAHGNVGCVVAWLRGELEATPDQLAAWMFSCMPAVLREAYAARAGR